MPSDFVVVVACVRKVGESYLWYYLYLFPCSLGHLQLHLCPGRPQVAVTFTHSHSYGRRRFASTDPSACSASASACKCLINQPFRQRKKKKKKQLQISVTLTWLLCSAWRQSTRQTRPGSWHCTVNRRTFHTPLHFTPPSSSFHLPQTVRRSVCWFGLQQCVWNLEQSIGQQQQNVFDSCLPTESTQNPQWKLLRRGE